PHFLSAFPGHDRLGHAVLGVIGEQPEGDALEGGPGRVDLGQDVDAVAVLFDHLLDPSDLALDAAQPGLDGPLVCRVTWHWYMIPLRGIADICALGKGSTASVGTVGRSASAPDR